MPSKIVEKLHSIRLGGDLSFKPHYSDSARSYKSPCGEGGCGQELPNLHFARQHFTSVRRRRRRKLKDDGNDSWDDTKSSNCISSNWGSLTHGVLELVCRQAATFWDVHFAHATGSQCYLAITTTWSMQFKAAHVMHASNATNKSMQQSNNQWRKCDNK